MNKNLISMLILALVLANLILTAVIMLTVLPQTKAANNLIAKVAAAIDLDIKGAGGAGIGEGAAVSPEHIEEYSVNGGEPITVNLKPGADGVAHYAIVKSSLSINTKSKDFKKFGSEETLKAKDVTFQSAIQNAISAHTLDELRSNQQAVQEEAAKKICALYGDTDLIVDVAFVATYQ
ncbi:hypothetical protein FACS1894111_02490 [Clostridia bacterium]|nr:hypothetical protein FACS1894111_02490 [Clostridia bacterium]